MNHRQQQYIDMLKEAAPYSKKTIWWFRAAGLITLGVLGGGYWALFMAVGGHLSLWMVMIAELVGVAVMVAALAASLRSRRQDIERYRASQMQGGE